jgi:hypothetical protein
LNWRLQPAKELNPGKPVCRGSMLAFVPYSTITLNDKLNNTDKFLKVRLKICY